MMSDTFGLFSLLPGFSKEESLPCEGELYNAADDIAYVHQI
jgi:hypothetical protein